MIALTCEPAVDGFFTVEATVKTGPGEYTLQTAESWWWTVKGIGTSRNSGKAVAYALEDLAKQILKEESRG